MLRNVLAQALRPGRAAVMAKKVLRRWFDDEGTLSREENLAWLKRHHTRFDDLAAALDPALWEETKTVMAQIQARAGAVLAEVEYDLGGAAAYPILYFIARYLRPACIVETGVAAGFSSYALLAAIEKNGVGRLYSSDFPYFRLPNPERYAGIVVPDALREKWSLLMEGDEANLPQIVDSVEQIDLFHYDSDKSYSGRRFALATVAGKMSANGVILMDDVDDNAFFHDYVHQHGIADWSVFAFKRVYVGLIGKLARR